MEGTPPMSSYEDETGVKLIIIIIIIINDYRISIAKWIVRSNRQWEGFYELLFQLLSLPGFHSKQNSQTSR